MKNYLIMLCVVCVWLAGCAKPYIGKPLNYLSPGICFCINKPCHCEIATEHFRFTFDIQELAAGKYVIQGETVRQTREKDDWTVSLGTFDFLIASQGTILENVQIVPKMNMLSSSKPAAFNREFECKTAFDAVTVTYSLQLTK
jgi:hypothetical protein